jgi:hypothetical protein
MGFDLSRREFLRYAGTAAFLPLLDHIHAPGPAPALGRLVTATYVRDAAKPDGKILKTLAFNDLVTITEAVEGTGLWPTNIVWYNTPDGYVYSSFVQPVENAPQPVVWELPPEGYWAEVSIPFVPARGKPDPAAWRSYLLYYSSVFRVIGVQAAADGSAWYGLAEWSLTRPSFYVPAESMRIIPASDLTPLSPGADKSIKVTLSTQVFEAFENGQLVYSGHVASGLINRTPTGHHKVVRKGASSHMTGGSREDYTYYDLPGVPFCTYFTWMGNAIHGTYWHNDYGRPRSHGCVNVSPTDARWVFRWTEPAVPYDTRSLSPITDGTPVEVVW